MEWNSGQGSGWPVPVRKLLRKYPQLGLFNDCASTVMPTQKQIVLLISITDFKARCTGVINLTTINAVSSSSLEALVFFTGATPVFDVTRLTQFLPPARAFFTAQYASLLASPKPAKTADSS